MNCWSKSTVLNKCPCLAYIHTYVVVAPYMLFCMLFCLLGLSPILGWKLKFFSIHTGLRICALFEIALWRNRTIWIHTIRVLGVFFNLQTTVLGWSQYCTYYCTYTWSNQIFQIQSSNREHAMSNIWSLLIRWHFKIQNNLTI